MFLANKIALFCTWVQKYFFAERCCIACKTPYVLKDYLVFTHEYLCPDCLAQMPKKAPLCCKLCGHPLHNEKTQEILCLQCIKSPPPWDALQYFSPYKGLLKVLMVRYKFSKDFSIIPLLSRCLSCAIQTLPSCDILITMPRHKKRLGSEGYNQVLELCRPLKKTCQIPLALHSLQRIRHTVPQVGLMAKQRLANPIKSFAAQEIKGKKVLLVDDVITTGATLHHACLALRNAGASHVYIALIARAEK